MFTIEIDFRSICAVVFFPKEEAHTHKACTNTVQILFNQRNIFLESPANATRHLWWIWGTICVALQINKELEKGTLDSSFVSDILNKTTEEEKRWFSTSEGEKMDLFVWLCGCLLAFILPSAVKAEEGGKFDTFAARSNHTVTSRC